MKRPLRIALPILIVIAGILITVAMVKFKPKASRSRPPRPAAVVEVFEAARSTQTAVVSSTGEVVAAEQITLVPQVGGRIDYSADSLMPGGRFQKGETLARIESADYELAVRQTKSAVRQAELDLSLEKNRQETALREWEILGDDRPESEASLALRKPHLAAAEENWRAALSALEQAKLNLARTRLTAPFDCVVVEENVDVGQVVGTNSALATLVGTDRFRVLASVPVDKLHLIEIPGYNAETGSSVRIEHDLGGGVKASRDGVVARLGGQLDPRTRTAQILVVIENPLDPPEGQRPILNGAYVDLKIQGRPLENVFVIPRTAIVNGDRVWLADEKDRLRSRRVTSVWADAKTVAVTEGLEDGDRIVVTPLSLPIEGMPVRVQGDEPVGAAASDEESGDAS